MGTENPSLGGHLHPEHPYGDAQLLAGAALTGFGEHLGGVFCGARRLWGACGEEKCDFCAHSSLISHVETPSGRVAITPEGALGGSGVSWRNQRGLHALCRSKSSGILLFLPVKHALG